MAQTHVFPQSGDNDDAENFAQLIGRDNLTEYVETGMGFTVDYTVPEVTIATGVAYIGQSSETTSSTSETRLSTGEAVQLDQATKSLTDNDVNYIYIEPDFSTDDNATFQVYTNETNASSTALKIGEIDTSNDTATELNREPDGVFHDLDVEGAFEVTGPTVFSGDVTLGDDLFATDGEVIWDESAGYIPQGRLENDSITANAGDGLKNGSTVSLGGSFTFDIEPADFAGAGVEDDGSDNLRVDEQYDFTFTSIIDFRSGWLVDPTSSGLTDDGSVDAPDVALRGYYDSDTTSSVSATTLDFLIDHQVSYNGGAGSSTTDLRVGGTNILRLRDEGRVGIPNGNLRLATGQAIEDGGSVRIIETNTSYRNFFDDAGNLGLNLDHGQRHALYAQSVTPVQIQDSEGGFKAVEYRTSSTAPGTLELTNANIDGQTGLNIKGGTSGQLTIENADTATAITQWFAQVRDDGSLQIRDNTSGTNVAEFTAGGGRFELFSGIDLRLATGQAIEDGSGTARLSIGSGGTTLRAENGQGYVAVIGGSNLVDMSNTPVNLRLDTGNAIEDGSGTNRVGFGGTETKINNDAGNSAALFRDSALHRIYATSTANFQVWDGEAGNIAYRYMTSSSAPGTLELTNAILKVTQTGSATGNSTLSLYATDGSGTGIFSQADHGVLEFADARSLQLRSNDGTEIARAYGSGRFDISNGNLRLATGNAIEDGSAIERISLDSSGTVVRDQNENPSVSLEDGTGNFIRAYSNTPIQFGDQVGDFTALKYRPSSSAPGTLELTNAKLVANSADTEFGNYGVRWNSNGSNDTTTPVITNFVTNGVTELRGEDGAGNQTTLT